jgi:membrane protease YdiL (CAAX protease family)
MPIKVRIALFFALSCALTWWPFVVGGFSPDGEPTNFALGPLIAAPLTISLTEGAGGVRRWLLRLAKIRAPIWVYATAFFGPLGIAALATLFARAIGTPATTLPSYGFDQLIFYLGIVLAAGPLPEEVSFRGYGQHELQETMSPFAASLWIGAGVVIWHVPLFVAGEDSWLIVVAIMAVSVVYGWLYCAGGSVWPVVLVHFTHNYLGAGFFQESFAGPDRMPFVAFLSLFYVAWAALIVWRVGPSLGRERGIDAAGAPAMQTI